MKLHRSPTLAHASTRPQLRRLGFGSSQRTQSRTRELVAGLGRVTALAVCAAVALGGAAMAASPLDGRLVVRNDRAQAVRVTVDGAERGVVAPRSRRVLRHVPNGVRVVDVASPGLPVERHEVAIAPRGKAKLRLAPLLGSARVRNDSGVAMRLRLDGRVLGVVARDGALETARIPAGVHRLLAEPAEPWAQGGPPVERTLRVRAGSVETVRLRPWLAVLKVRNPLPVRARVFLDGRRVAAVAPGDWAVLPGLVPGRHTVALRARGRTVATTALTAPMGQTSVWQPPVPRRGDLRVSNRSPRRVVVRLDGQRLALLRPGETRLFQDLPAGPHRLVLVHKIRHHERIREARAIRIAPFQQATVRVDGPRQAVATVGAHPRPMR